MMRATIICSDMQHPVYPVLADWIATQDLAQIELVTKTIDAVGGDFLFLVSCSEIIRADTQSRYRHTLVIHASDLPKGRGWSPQIWAIVEGAEQICLSLLEAGSKVDTGAIWAQRLLPLRGDELYDEINAALFAAEVSLIEHALKNAETIVPQLQDEAGATYLRKRTPEDSRIDPERSIAQQFDLLRVCDPARFPAFFDLRGCRYRITLEKMPGDLEE